jgi:hypothetical protein
MLSYGVYTSANARFSNKLLYMQVHLLRDLPSEHFIVVKSYATNLSLKNQAMVGLLGG